jgi:tetratricopeptide (TPR) repeat protein
MPVKLVTIGRCNSRRFPKLNHSANSPTRNQPALWQVLVVFSACLILWRAFQWYRPRDLSPLLERGLASVDKNRTGEAQVSLDSLIGLAPKSPQVALLNGALLLQQKKVHDALSALEKAKSHEGTSDKASFYLGKAHHQLGHMCLAAIEFKEALKSDPTNKENLRLLADSYHQLGASDKAIEIADQLAPQAAGDIELLYHAARIHLENKSFHRAVELLKGCLTMSPGKHRISVLEDLAIALLETDQIDEFKSILPSIPLNTVKALTANARFQFKTGYAKAAEESLREALDIEPGNNLLKTLLENGGLNPFTEMQAGLEDLRSQAASDLANAEMRFQVGMEEIQMGLIPQAKRTFKEVISLSPSFLRAHEVLAQLNAMKE